MHKKFKSSYPARITSGWLRDVLALKEEPGKCSPELIFNKHLSIGVNEEPGIDLSIRFLENH